MKFDEWLRENTKLGDSSIYKYSRAINTVSNEMISTGVIIKPLEYMEIFEIDLAIPIILKNPQFVFKDKTGNSMYSCALRWYRDYANSQNLSQSVAKEEEFKIMSETSLSITEKEAIVKARIGQGLFRDNLLKRYQRCIITGINIPKLLIASHIKPWAISDNKERISQYNGFLLSPTYDKLFDSGFITFDIQGNLKISHYVDSSNKQKLGIVNNTKYDIKYCSDMKEFIQYHNDIIFKG